MGGEKLQKLFLLHCNGGLSLGRSGESLRGAFRWLSWRVWRTLESAFKLPSKVEVKWYEIWLVLLVEK